MAAILLGLCGSALANPALLLSSASVAAGQPATLTLSLNSEVMGACGLMLTLVYNTATPSSAPPIQLNSLSQDLVSMAFSGSGALYASSGITDPVTGLPFDQQRRIAIVQAVPVDGPADVMSLPFQAPQSAPVGTVYAISVSVVANDAFGNKFDVDPATGTVTVSGPAILAGDVNGDGKVDIRDALLVLRAILHLETLAPDQQARADVNHDGQMNISDAIAILDIAVGLGGPPP